MTRTSLPVHEVVLDNGFRAIVVERHNLPVVASVLWYRVGSRDECAGESGLSHFLEHMMFKGTERYAKGEIDWLTSSLGGSNNAFTDQDSTVYHFSLPAERWDTALEIEADRMRGCTLDPVEFAAEKQVVLEELAMGRDDPWTSLFQAVEATAFERHPYRRPIIGFEHELEDTDVDTMRAYYQRHYGVDRSFAVVVGAVERGRAEERIDELFGGLPRAGARAPVEAEPLQVGERRRVVHAPGNLARAALACHTCRIGERDDFALDLVAQVLGGGKSSRLHRALVIEQNLATQVGVHNDVRLDPGLFWIWAELHPGVDVGAAERALREEIARLLDGGAMARELELARAQTRAAFVFEDETVLGAALKLGRFEALTGSGWRLAEEPDQVYASISADELAAVAGRYFGADRWTVGWSLPAEAARE